MKRVVHILIALVIGIGIGWGISTYITKNTTRNRIDLFFKEINRLQTKIYKLESINKELQQQADSLELQLGKYDSTVVNLNKTINGIKIKNRQALDNVTRLNDDELESFITGWVKARTDTIR